MACEIGPTKLKFHQLKYCCCPDVGTTTMQQRRFFLSNGPMMDQHIFVDCYRVIFLNINLSKLYLNSSTQYIRGVLSENETGGGVQKSNEMDIS